MGLEQAKDLLDFGPQCCKKLLETVYERNTLTWHSNSKFFFSFFPNSFLSIESPLISREKHPVSNVEYILFSVACLENSVGYSSLEFKFHIEILPYSFCFKTSSVTYSCGGSVRKRSGIDNGCKTAWTK